MLKKLVSVLVISIFASTITACSNPTAAVDNNSSFVKLDLNNDKVISQDEFGANSPAKLAEFYQIDANRDGKIAPSELASKGNIFNGLDLNKDSFISQDEFGVNSPNRLTAFYKIDTNRDGKLTQEEITF